MKKIFTAVALLALLLSFGCIGGAPAPTPAAALTPTPTVAIEATPTLAPSPSPSPSPTPSPAPEVRKLEEGIEGLPAGTAGWANTIALKEALKWRGDAVLAEVLVPGPGCLSEDGKTLAGSINAFNFYYSSPTVMGDYKVVVSLDGAVSKGMAPEEDRGVLTNWLVDSDEIFLKVKQLGKTGCNFRVTKASTAKEFGIAAGVGDEETVIVVVTTLPAQSMAFKASDGTRID